MTVHQLLLEQIEDQWVGHVAGLPGCFANGAQPSAVLESAPAAIEEYARWRAEREPGFSVVSGNAEIAEQFPSRRVGDYEINAFFDADRPALTEAEVVLVDQLMQWTRQSLLRSTLGLHEADMRLPLRGEKWSILGVLAHVANAENWYLDRLGRGASTEKLPDDAFKRLEKTRAIFFQVLAEFPGAAHIGERDGELWSARKVVRRALWHERDHTAHIRKLRARLES